MGLRDEVVRADLSRSGVILESRPFPGKAARGNSAAAADPFGCSGPRSPYSTTATASISMSMSDLMRRETSTRVVAGGWSPKNSRWAFP